MKRAPSLLALAATPALALALVVAGNSSSKGHEPLGRHGKTDAEKLADLERDAKHWLDERRDRGDDRERYRELRPLDWRAPSSSLTVDGGQNGGAMVTGWSRDEVRVIARVEARARSAARARDLARQIRIVNHDGRLAADGPRTRGHESWSVLFDVLAPRETNLRLTATNGPVGASDMDAAIEARTVNGPVVLSALAGDVHARTQNGPVAVTLAGTRWHGAGLDASTTNGPVALSIPRGYSCRLETGTLNGPFRSDIEIANADRRVTVRRQHITATLGRGGPLVRATTTNGPVVITYAGRSERTDEEED